MLLAAAAPGHATDGDRAQDRETILGAPAAIDPGSEEHLEVAAGSHLHSRPDNASMLLAVVDSPIELEAIERQGDWFLVRYGSRRGWIDPDEPDHEVYGASRLLPHRQPATAAAQARQQARLAAAAETLGMAPEPVEFGAFRILTDVEDRRLLARLRGAATSVAGVYRQRYGLDPGDGPHGDVVLFRREEDYRRYEQRDPELAALGAGGHSHGSLGLLFVTPARTERTVAVFVHELVHLLNRRALGEQLAPWLEEGTANDLSFSSIDRRGRIAPGSLGGEVETVTLPVQTRLGTGSFYAFTFSGPRAALRSLAESQRRRSTPTLEQLVDLSWFEFVDSPQRQLHYAIATFGVRYLLDGEQQRFADAFCAYLSRIARGEETTGADLPRALDRSWEELQGSFRSWVRNEAALLEF